MFEGFIPGSRGTLILDIIVVAMGIVLIGLAYSIQMARIGKYELHRKIQTYFSIILAIAVILFEIDMRVYGWTHLAKPSPYYDSWVFPSLYLHIAFSTSAAITWSIVLWKAFTNFSRPVKRPGAYGETHKKWAKLAIVLMAGTTFTGWGFYYLAFIA